jgi:hypothetical protein
VVRSWPIPSERSKRKIGSSSPAKPSTHQTRRAATRAARTSCEGRAGSVSGQHRHAAEAVAEGLVAYEAVESVRSAGANSKLPKTRPTQTTLHRVRAALRGGGG